MRAKDSKHNTVRSETSLSYPTEAMEDMYMKIMKNICAYVE